VIPAGTGLRYTNLDGMAKRYKVDRTAAAQWSSEDGFPPVLFATGQGRTLVFDEVAVDEWVRRNHVGSWLRSRSEANPLGLPEGNPRDLLPLRRIAELEGRALDREPTPLETLRSYISKGTLARPDRHPDDGQRPVVTEPMWFRETAYAFINRPRRTRRVSTAASGAPGTTDPLVDLELPEGGGSDLLTLAEIAALDGTARGRGKATSIATLRKHLSQKLLDKADRVPGDGKEPAVDERSWYRDTAYRYIRRPGKLGPESREPIAPTGPLLDLKLPAGKSHDLLTLEQIGNLDVRARGRGTTSSISTLRTHLAKGILPKADRVPGDGKEPPVEEPSWRRDTAYRYIQRPDARRGQRR
jgi:hypothetical protein